MHDAPCPLCGSSNNYDVLYKSNVRPENLNPTTFSARRLPDKLHFQIVKCQKDGLVRSSPVANEKTLANLYKKSCFSYQEEVANLTKTYLKALETTLTKPTPGVDQETPGVKRRILEIGCGNGFMLKALYDLGYKNVFGIEPSKEAVSKAHQSIKKHIKIDILRPNQFIEKFDLLLIFQTLDHISDPNRFLSICHSLLKKNGLILAFNHNVDSLQHKILKEKSPIIDIEHTFLYSPKTIKAIFEKNHFTPIKVYNPANFVSIKHLVKLFPFPNWLKLLLLKNVPQKTLLVKLGNLCIIGRK